MKRNHTLTLLALAAVTGAALSTAALARGPGDGMMGMMGGGEMGPMADFATLDSDGDGKVTPQELAAARAARIAGLDANGDGKLSEDEIVAHRMAQMQARAAEMAKAMIAARDADGDGLLSVEEMAAPAMPARMFQRLDADGDGAISAAEMEAARDRMQGRRADRGERGGRMGHHSGGDHDGMGYRHRN